MQCSVWVPRRPVQDTDVVKTCSVQHGYQDDQYKTLMWSKHAVCNAGPKTQAAGDIDVTVQRCCGPVVKADLLDRDHAVNKTHFHCIMPSVASCLSACHSFHQSTPQSQVGHSALFRVMSQVGHNALFCHPAVCSQGQGDVTSRSQCPVLSPHCLQPGSGWCHK